MTKKVFYVVLYALLGLSLVVLFVRYGVNPIINKLGYQPKAGVKVLSTPIADVYFNDIKVGNTPFEDDSLTNKIVKVKLQSQNSKWEQSIKLYPGTVTVINRELSPTSSQSAGEVLTLNPGQGVVVVATPNGSQVEVDGNPAGQTPFSNFGLPSGDHIFLIKHDGFLGRSIQAQLPEGMGLTIEADLAVFQAQSSASSSAQLSTPKSETQTGVVRDTPNGFLRMRGNPSLSSPEVARAREGDELTILDKTSGWYKVRLDSWKEGYVSAQYIQIK